MNQKPTKPRGVMGAALLRVSKDVQDHESQRLVIERWAKDNGLNIARWFYDTGSRHKAESRSEFQRLLQTVEAGLLDWVVIDRQDRFGHKNNYEFGKFVTTLREHNCELWSATQGLLSSDDDVTVLTNAIGSLTSKREQQEKANRSLRAKMAAAEKGLWPGSYPAYGYDVVCYGSDGKEKWRVVYEGHYRRVKVNPDKTTERYDGKDNFPSHDKTDVLKYAPSVVQARIDAIRYIFEQYATTSISFRGLAHKLNEAGVDPGFGNGWYSSRISFILRHPIYIGFPAYNKKGHGAFMEFVGGRIQEVEWSHNQAKTGRRRDRNDWILPSEPTVEPIIDKELWDRVQAKLAGVKMPKRPPRSSELWLSGFLYCASCMRPMGGWHPRNPKHYNPRCYICSTYRSRGRANQSGCRLNRARADVIEALVDRYLEETGQRLQDMIVAEAERTNGILHPQKAALDTTLREAAALKSRIREKVKQHNPDYKLRFADVISLHVYERNGQSLPLAPELESEYLAFCKSQEARWKEELHEKEARLEKMVAGFVDLTGDRARQIANRQIEALEGEIEELRGQLENLTEKLARVHEELALRLKGLREAEATLRAETPRRKAEALRGVIDKIICSFTHYQRGKHLASRL